MQLLENVQITLALMICCVPEGLPLAVSMAMAFSTDRLKKENLLIKDTAALEIAGSLVDIMTGKTCTLTEGKMRVGTFWAANASQQTVGPNLSADVMQTINECIILNSDARMEINDRTQCYVPKGSPVEVGMLGFLMDN